jgi:hypothetical protein
VQNPEISSFYGTRGFTMGFHAPGAGWMLPETDLEICFAGAGG